MWQLGTNPALLAVQDKYGGWLDEQVVEDFAAYAQVCFKAFGKRVQHWTTFNEPLTFVFQGYSTGTHAPGTHFCLPSRLHAPVLAGPIIKG